MLSNLKLRTPKLLIESALNFKQINTLLKKKKKPHKDLKSKQTILCYDGVITKTYPKKM